MFKIGDRVEIRLDSYGAYEWNGTQMILEKYSPVNSLYYGPCIKRISTNPDYIVIGYMLRFRHSDFVEIEHV